MQPHFYSMIVVVPTHRPVVYPKKTAYACPSCGAPVVIDEATNVTHADHDGNPVEETSVGFYCENELCDYHREAMEEDWLSFASSPPTL